MQPYFFPYIGYFQLMNMVDEFVIYDNIEYSKKGWINRNRILVNGKDTYLTLPLKKDSDFLNVRNRYLSDIWLSEKMKMLNKLTESYRKSPNFNLVYPIIEKCILLEQTNLFEFILNSLKVIQEYLDINTPVTVSSEIPIDHKLKSEKRVIAMCKAIKAKTYINSIGGIQLYRKEHFKDEGITLHFLKTGDIRYMQFNSDFVPNLSIIDMMMFLSKEEVKEHLNSSYSLE